MKKTKLQILNKIALY